MIALGINSTAYISEIVRGGIDSIADGQWEAAYVVGLKPFKTMKEVILPQMFHTNHYNIYNQSDTYRHMYQNVDSIDDHTYTLCRHQS